jgi:hypothetical protein
VVLVMMGTTLWVLLRLTEGLSGVCSGGALWALLRLTEGLSGVCSGG